MGVARRTADVNVSHAALLEVREARRREKSSALLREINGAWRPGKLLS